MAIAKKKLSPALVSYFDIRDEIVVQDGLLLRDSRLVVPKGLQKCLIQALYSNHQGIESTLRFAREAIYWPNIIWCLLITSAVSLKLRDL